MGDGRHNPLRSEEEAFRWVVVIVAGAGVVIAVAVAAGPTAGAIAAAALLGLGAGVVWRGSRGRLPQQTEIARREGDRHRILVIANQTVAGRALLDEIRGRAQGREAEILVVTPALTSQIKHWVSDIDEAVEGAKQRLETSLATLRAAGIEARGEVGDSEPNVAIEDALRTFGADEVIVSTHPPGRSHWLEKGVVERARQEIDLPVTHVVVDLEAEAAARDA